MKIVLFSILTLTAFAASPAFAKQKTLRSMNCEASSGLKVRSYGAAPEADEPDHLRVKLKTIFKPERESIAWVIFLGRQSEINDWNARIQVRVLDSENIDGEAYVFYLKLDPSNLNEQTAVGRMDYQGRMGLITLQVKCPAIQLGYE